MDEGSAALSSSKLSPTKIQILVKFLSDFAYFKLFINFLLRATIIILSLMISLSFVNTYYILYYLDLPVLSPIASLMVISQSAKIHVVLNETSNRNADIA